jgi:hypothetical protein
MHTFSACGACVKPGAGGVKFPPGHDNFRSPDRI